MQEKDVTILQWLWNNDYDNDVHERFDKSGVEQGIISDFAKKKDQFDEETLAKLSEALELFPECFCKSVMVEGSVKAREYDSICADIEGEKNRLDCFRYFKAIPSKYVGDFVSLDREEYQKAHKKSPVCDRGFKGNTLVIRGRDGSVVEKELTDDQVKDLQTIVDQLPDAPDDL